MRGINALSYVHTTILWIQKNDASYNKLITRLATQLKCPTHHPPNGIPKSPKTIKTNAWKLGVHEEDDWTRKHIIME